MTPAIEQLRLLGVTHEVVAYPHDPGHPSYGDEAAEALGVDPSSVFKTLVIEIDGTHPATAIVPVTCTLDLKAAATALGGKRAALADRATAERRTGYVLGGISPFGHRHEMATAIDEWATALDVIHCSGGRRGLEVVLDPSDLVRVLDAVVAPIASWP